MTKAEYITLLREALEQQVYTLHGTTTWPGHTHEWTCGLCGGIERVGHVADCVLALPVPEERRFPVLGAGFSIPWELVAPFEAQALTNHDQTLQRLATRGGLSPLELWCVMHGKKWHARSGMTEERAKEWALSLLAGAPR